MKIALIHCPFEHKIFSENLKVVDEEFCLAPPVILAYVAAILEKSGHKVILIDANALKLTKEKTLKILEEFKPEILGFRADTYWFHRIVEWASFFKAAMGVKIIVGGINITLYPKESLAYPCFDFGIIGEANISLPLLIEAISKNNEIDNMSGIVYRKKRGIVVNTNSNQIIDFDSYPFPARHLLPNHLYYSFTSQRKNYTIMVTSTGCPHKCNFCAISKLPYRQRSPQKVVDEIEECHFKYDVREIDFFDATFFINKQRSMEICDEIIKRGLKIEWSCRSRVDTVDNDILKIAAQAGCKKIYYGIESASQHTLSKINKGISHKQIKTAIELTNKNGINSLGFFMIGNPDDTPKSVINSIKFAKELKLDFIQVCKLIPKPNTDLNNMIINTHKKDYWREYILEQKTERRLPTPWTAMSEEEIDKYARKFYRDFYFRPSYILRKIIKIKSMEELIRYIKTSFKWFFCNS